MRKSLIMVQYTVKQLFPENKCYHFYSFELESLTFELFPFPSQILHRAKRFGFSAGITGNADYVSGNSKLSFLSFLSFHFLKSNILYI